MRPLFDFVMAFVTAVDSSVDEQTKTTRVTTTGIAGFDFDGATSDLPDADGELADNQEMFGALGVLARPLDPETIQGKDYRAEALAVRTADGLIPVAWRDLRLDRYFPNGLPKGSARLVGYGGSFFGFDVKDGTSGADTENLVTVAYVPYAYTNGIASKAHAIIVDPDPANGITLTHGDGYQMAITEDGLLWRTPDAETFMQMKEGELTVTAKKIMLKGTTYIGQAAEAGIPLLPGPVSPPCPSLFVSPQ